jgi:uncharacterized membrane protein SpoIIM required for sporulation
VVFEHIFPESFLEKRAWVAFFLAIIASTVSIVVARMLFPANSGIVSIVFLSLLLLPSFSAIFKTEERKERKEKQWSFKRLYEENKTSFGIYLMLFFGIYLTYMLYAFFVSSFGADVGSVFREQLSLESVRGNSIFSGSKFLSIFINNWWVLLACFLVALIAGDGALFFVAWNASVWGTVFGYRAAQASAHSGESGLWLLLVIFVITLPHVLLEGAAYIFAAIAGGVLSDEIVEKSEQIKEFVLYFLCAALLYGIVYMVLSVFLERALLGLAAVVLALCVLHFMHHIFASVRDRMVFKYNFYLFVVAIGVFFIAALIEVLVLANATPLREIYYAAGS